MSGSLLYETELKLEHNMPFSNLSKIIPRSEIQRWCNLEVDILELSGDNYKLKQLKDMVLSALVEIGAEVLHTRIYGEKTFEAVVKCRCTRENSTIAILEKNKVIPVMPIAYKEGFEFVKFLAYKWSELRLAIKALSTVSNVVILSRRRIYTRALSTMTVPLKEILGSLTWKQLDSLMKAIEFGYYEIPSKITIDSIAKRLGLARSTYEEHLRKAEVKVMNALKPYIRIAHLAENS
jgi:predicted DNA binding protein